jgi:dTDP-4-dehydrorhamnose 3,5-epimerase
VKFHKTPLSGCYALELTPFSDERGWFARTYCTQEFGGIGHSAEWLQINHSFTKKKGTIRGLHYQHKPYSEIKLVRCIAGSVYDVVIDIRKDSASFLQWFSIELSAVNKKMIYIPEGFAHGFQTLSDDTELIYHHSAVYQPGSEGGIKYNDPVFNIQWPHEVSEISERDNKHPFIDSNFKAI